MQYSSIIILYNPNSTGPSQRKAERLAKRLAKIGYEDNLRVVATEHSGHGEELAYKFAKQSDRALIISSSGDGGYHEVINGVIKANLEGSNASTGLLPSGNANDHHKELHSRDIIKQIKDGHEKQIDLITIEAVSNGKPWKRYAHSYIGFGISPEISKELNKIDLNPAKEILISIKSLATTRPFSIINGGKQHIYFSMVISNVSRMGKFFNLSRESTIDDGKFEVFTIVPNRAKILGTIFKSATGGVPHTKQTNKFSFKTVDRLPVQLDGEVYEIDADCNVVVRINRKVLSCVI